MRVNLAVAVFQHAARGIQERRRSESFLDRYRPTLRHLHEGRPRPTISRAGPLRNTAMTGRDDRCMGLYVSIPILPFVRVGGRVGGRRTRRRRRGRQQGGGGVAAFLIGLFVLGAAFKFWQVTLVVLGLALLVGVPWLIVTNRTPAPAAPVPPPSPPTPPVTPPVVRPATPPTAAQLAAVEAQLEAAQEQLRQYKARYQPAAVEAPAPATPGAGLNYTPRGLMGTKKRGGIHPQDATATTDPHHETRDLT